MAKIEYYKKKIEIGPTKPATILGSETEAEAKRRLHLAAKHSKKKGQTRIKANDVLIGNPIETNMNYDEIGYANLAFGIGLMTDKPDEGLETVEKMAQSRAYNKCELPKDISPNKEAFEAVGFIFEDIGDDVLYKTTLPDGWKLKHVDSKCYDIIDNKGRTRGYSFYKGAFYDRCGNMRLRQRYNVVYEHINPDDYKSPITVFVSDSDGAILFTAGKCDHPYCEEYKILQKECIEYLNSHFPEWEDVTKYWD